MTMATDDFDRAADGGREDWNDSPRPRHLDLDPQGDGPGSLPGELYFAGLSLLQLAIDRALCDGKCAGGYAR
jgi:hypothetical protein